MKCKHVQPAVRFCVKWKRDLICDMIRMRCDYFTPIKFDSSIHYLDLSLLSSRDNLCRIVAWKWLFSTFNNIVILVLVFLSIQSVYSFDRTEQKGLIVYNCNFVTEILLLSSL